MTTVGELIRALDAHAHDLPVGIVVGHRAYDPAAVWRSWDDWGKTPGVWVIADTPAFGSITQNVVDLPGWSR